MTKKIITFFTDGGTPKTGLSATIRIRDLSTSSLVITDAAMTEVGDGFYYYDFTSYDEDEEYSIRCDGTSTITNPAERYTYAGNESYVDDIWDAQTTDHQETGSMGYEIRGAGGVLVGGNHSGVSHVITQEEAMNIAKKVWEVMLNNDHSAKEVLLSRSDFNAIKDTVLINKSSIPELLDYKKDFMSLQALVFGINNKIKTMIETEPAEIVMPNNLVSEISEALKKTTEMSLSVNGILSSMNSAANTVENSVDELSGKITTLDGQLAGTNLDLSKANEIAGALTVFKESLMTLMSLASVNDVMAQNRQSKEMMKRTMINLANIKFMSLRK